MEYEFKLSYHLADHDADADALVERLGAAGCDDALVGIGQPGRLALAFTREADDALGALTSALADVRRAIPGARLIEAGPDLVGLTDIADIAGVSRQNMRKLAQHHFRTFPTPVHEGSSALWHLSEVLDWMAQRGSDYNIAPATAEVARVARQLNLARQAAQLSPAMLREVAGLFA